MIDGLAVVDKPAGWTSHDVVARCRRIFGQKRVGHAGTLDPDATGVLLVGLGRVTRLLRFLTALGKSYTGEVVLGSATTTLDAGGDVVGEWDMESVTLEQVRAAAHRFVGRIEQVPPMVSAVKVGGRRLHELARAGQDVARAARTVEVYELGVEPGSEPGVFVLAARCSSGTYVRTLAADLGEALGGGAHLRNLRRTAVGSFTADVAVPVERLGPDDVVAPVEALRDYPVTIVDEPAAAAVSHGRPLPGAGGGATGGGPVRVVDREGRLLAVYEPADGELRPAVVVAPAG